MNDLKKSYILKILSIILILLLSVSLNINAQMFNNNGVGVYNTTFVRVLGDVSNNNAGIIENDGTFVIDSNIINNATINGDGLYKVSGNWENNLSFNSGTSKVILEGINQLITGTAISSYYDLELTGSGIKTQTIDSYTTDSLILNDRELATDINTMFVSNTDTGAISRTTGFVSSLGDGCLSRATNNNFVYLFPVGSSLITTRYRPVEIKPATANPNTYTVRLANNDATTDGYDRGLLEAGICIANPAFYHRINQTSGADPADITIYYDEISDGLWEGIAQWNIIPLTQWEDVGIVTAISATPLNSLTKTAWNDFSIDPYILTIPSLVINLGNDTAFCNGNTVTLDAGIGDSYLWSDNSTGQTLNVSTTGVFSVTVTAGTCIGTDTIVVTVNPTPDIDDIIDQTVCDSYTLPAITGTNLTGNENYYTATGGGGSIVTSPVTTTQTIYIYDETGTTPNCFDEESYTITISPSPDVDDIADQTVCNSYTLPVITGTDLTGNENYYTATGGGGSVVTSPITATQTIYIYDETGTTPNCFDEESYTITISPSPDVDDIADQTVCNSYTLPVITGTDLTGNENYYTATGGGGSVVTSPITTTQTIYIYDETGTTPNCFDEESFIITISPSPDVDNIADQTVCDSYTLPVITGTNLTGNENYYTATGGGGSIVTSPITTTQTIYIYDETGTTPNCFDEESFTVTIGSINPTYVNISICDGESIFIGNAWQTTDGTFYDTLLSVAGCDSVIITNLTVNPVPDITITPVDPVCENNTIITLTSTPSGGVWTGNGITNSIAGLFNPNIAGSGTHAIIYTISGTCGDSDTIYIIVNPLPTVGISGDNEIMLGGNTILTATGGGTYQWTPSESLSCDNCQIVTATPTELTEYCVTVTDNNACINSECIKVFVNFECGELFIPNAFSPNGDGFNDVLYVEGECISTLYLGIYDRWGELVFESNDQHIGWDGTYKGKRMDDAVFMYYLKVSFTNLKIQELKGNISLIR